MSIKSLLSNFIVNTIITLKKDLDVPRQRLACYRNLKKNVEDMDRVQLGQLIRFYGHAIDKATKCENKFEGRGEEREMIVNRALQEWERRGYPLGPDKIWAKQVLENYNTWSQGPSKILHPVQPDRKPPEDLFTVIEQRRSVRFWEKKPIEKEKIKKIIEAATYAPSSCNRMTWHFFVTENSLQNVVEGDSTNPSLLRKAPLIIYIGIDERLYPEIYAPAIDAGCALQNLTLSAHALGLGTCLIYHCETVDQEGLRKELNIPEFYRIYCAVVLGYPNELAMAPARVNVDEVTTFTRRTSDEFSENVGEGCLCD